MHTHLAFRIAYGYQVKERDDPIVKVLFTAAHNLSVATTPGAFLVDSKSLCSKVLFCF
jgi:hypothetical protein